MPQMKKVWSTSGDDKVCSACSALEGMEIGMDGDFKFTSGRRTMEVELPPAHPRCACAVMYVEEKQQDLKQDEGVKNSEEETLESELGRFKERIREDDEMSQEYYQAVKEKFSHGSQDAKRVFNNYVDNDSIADSKYEGVACFKNGNIYAL